MPNLTRDSLAARIEKQLVDTFASDPSITVSFDGDRILVFAPGGPYLAVTVEELSLTPARKTRKKAS